VRRREGQRQFFAIPKRFWAGKVTQGRTFLLTIFWHGQFRGMISPTSPMGSGPTTIDPSAHFPCVLNGNCPRLHFSPCQTAFFHDDDPYRECATVPRIRGVSSFALLDNLTAITVRRGRPDAMRCCQAASPPHRPPLSVDRRARRVHLGMESLLALWAPRSHCSGAHAWSPRLVAMPATQLANW
jgi:hypothetical protein